MADDGEKVTGLVTTQPGSHAMRIIKVPLGQHTGVSLTENVAKPTSSKKKEDSNPLASQLHKDIFKAQNVQPNPPAQPLGYSTSEPAFKKR
jgi:hypothetical protein